MKTNIGKRKENQDFAQAFLNTNDFLLALLCDGLGGHRGGDVASEMAVSHIGNAWKQTDFPNPSVTQIKQWLEERINTENQHILKAAGDFSDLEGMGTTLVGAVYFENHLIVCNVGDSRVYGYRDGQMTQLTEDHSFINELRHSGQFSEDDIQRHINKHALTRSLGVNEAIETDFYFYEIDDFSHLLLCSDGLSNVVSAEEMAIIFKENETDSEKISEQLIDRALDNDASDNTTVLVISHQGEETVFDEEDAE